MSPFLGMFCRLPNKVLKNRRSSPFCTLDEVLVRCLCRRASTAATSPQPFHATFPFYKEEIKEERDEELDENSQGVANRSYWSRKIHILCSTPGRIDSALHLIDRLRVRGFRPDSANLSSIIHGLCAAGRYDEAHRRVLFSATSGLLPDDRSANVIIARLLDSSTPCLTLSVIHQLLLAKPAFVPSLTNYNRLIAQFCSTLEPFEANNLVTDMTSRGRYPNAVTYTTLIDGFGRVGLLEDARRVFDECLQRNIQPNSLTYSVLIRWLMRKRRVQESKEWMTRLWLRMQQEEDKTINSAAFSNLIDSLCFEGFFSEVFTIAEEMPQGKCVCEKFAYSQMVESLCKAGRYHGASRIVYIMRKKGFVPSLVSYNSIIHGLSKERGCMRAYQLFQEGIEFGYSLPEPTYKVLVEALCKEKDFYKAKDVAEFMLSNEGLEKTRIYNIFLSALRLMDNPSKQLNLLVLMLQKECHPDAVALNTVIHGFCKIGMVDEAMKILDDMMEGKFCSPDVVTFTTVISGLLDVGKLEEALHLLHKIMPQHQCAPSIVTYNAVLRGLFKLGKMDKLMEIFHEMVGKGVCADCMTHTVIIEGLFESSKLEQAKKFWDDIVWPSNIHDDYVYAAIIRGLSKLGMLDVASDFLYELVDSGISPGIVNYNILIDGATKHGMKKLAYQIVGEMRKNGLNPDSVTWRILHKLHERESKVFAARRDDNFEVNMSKELLIEENDECVSKFNGEHGDQLNGFVGHSLSAPAQDNGTVDGHVPQVQTYLHGPEIKLIGNRQQEPLWKLARKVFGLDTKLH